MVFLHRSNLDDFPRIMKHLQIDVSPSCVDRLPAPMRRQMLNDAMQQFRSLRAVLTPIGCVTLDQGARRCIGCCQIGRNRRAVAEITSAIADPGANKRLSPTEGANQNSRAKSVVLG